MFINPKVAIERGWIQGIKDPAKQVQPNAIDFTLDKLMTINTDGMPGISENYKNMRSMYDAPLLGSNWVLDGLRVYDGTSSVYVEVPEGVAAVLYTRSTLARNGVFLMSGLYDSGYKGNIGFTLYTIGGPITLEQGVRVGQIAFISAENAGMYAGGWNHHQGTHWTEDKPKTNKDILFGEGPDGAGKPAEFMDRYRAEKAGAPTQLERPIGHNPNKSEGAQKLEDTHKWDSEQVGKPAGTKNFF